MTFSKEPVVWVNLLQAVLIAAASFGLNLNPVQITAIVAVTNAVLAIWLRRKVSPVTPVVQVPPDQIEYRI